MDKLHPTQLEVLKECLVKGSGGMSLCMGFGKTLISLVLSMEQVGHQNGKILIIVAKNLLSTWELEIKKFCRACGKHTLHK